jgi:hypothetical protein
MKIQLQLNGSKTSEKHPILIGSIDIEGTRRVALWHHDDRGSEYYSGKLTQGDRDPDPINMRAMGAFAKANANDPDFATRDAFQVGDSMYFGYLWVRLDQDDEVVFDFEVTSTPYAQKLSDEVATFRARLKEKMSKRTPALLTHTDPTIDDIPF